VEIPQQWKKGPLPGETRHLSNEFACAVRASDPRSTTTLTRQSARVSKHTF
jgi:hypothetical protein